MKLAVFIFLLAVGSGPVLSKFVPLTAEDQLNDMELSKRSANGLCDAWGDPHYTTFDGQKYNFMGSCRYVQATDGCGTDAKGRPRLGTFKVIADNEVCGGGVSCVKAVDVIIGGETIHLSKGTYAPAPKDTATYSVTHEGSNVVVRTKPSGLIVKWNTGWTLDIELEPHLRGKVCGMCGNFDGNSANDFTTSSGSLTGDVNAFGNSWQAGGKCAYPPTLPRHPCEQNPGRRAVAMQDCAVIKSDAFQGCKDAGVDIDALFDDCVFDVCRQTTATKMDISCTAIKQASKECRARTNGKIHVKWGHLEKKCECTEHAMIENKRECCHFPFIYRGIQQFECVKQTNGKKPWCSSIANLDTYDHALYHAVGICED